MMDLSDDKNDDDNNIVKVFLPAPTWMLSFSDVAALMLTFFVLLFSMSTLLDNPSVTVSTLISTTETKDPAELPQPVSELGIVKRKLPPTLSPSYLSVLFKTKLSQLQLREAALTLTPRSLVISFPETFLFRPGGQELTRSAQQAIFDFSSLLQTLGNRVFIIGHLAPGDSEQSDLVDGWGLSLLQASAVGRSIRNAGYNGSLIVSGASDSEHAAVIETLPPRQREAYARRVDIVILNEGETFASAAAQ